MQKIDLEHERKILDREITSFHNAKAKRKIYKCLKYAKETNDNFFKKVTRAQRLKI